MNSTQLVGIIALAAAAAAALRRGREPAWRAVGVIFTVLAIEVWQGWRHALHSEAVDAMGASYPERGPIQYALLVVALLLATGVVRPLRQPFAPLPAPVAWATAGAVLLFAVEVVSFHAIDALLYRMLGPVKLIAWLWTASAASVVICSLDRPIRMRSR